MTKVNPLIVVFTLFTAIVHLVLLNLGRPQPDVLFTLNGLGYLAFLAALLRGFPKGQQRLLHYGFIAFTLATIIAWVVMGGPSILAYVTKAAEVALVVLLWQRLRSLPANS